MSLAADHKKSIAFLKWFAPQGPWNIVAISPAADRHISADTFYPGKEKQLTAFLSLKDSDNIYFTVNPIRRDLKKKPDRRDIKCLSWLHVDVDPRPREPMDTEQKRIAQLFKSYKPRPSCVVFSGGGYQAFWRLEEPFPIDGQEEAYEEAKLYNKQLEILFDADHCHNVDRIMRLPGTINWPTERKKEKGRKPALARVVAKFSDSYPLARFQKATQLQQNTRAPSRAIQVSGNIQRLESLEDLPIGGLCKSVIGVGDHPDDPTHYSSRSEAVWWVTCEMVRADMDDDTIFAIITDPDWGIAGHVLAQPRPEEYAIRQIERARELAEDSGGDLLEMNDKYAVVQVGGRARILQEPKNDDRPITLMTERDLSLLLANRRVVWNDGKRDQSMPLMKWWLQHPKRRTFYDLVFVPGKKARDGAYNLWRGFAYEAIPGDAEPFLSHLRDNICCGNQECYDYLIRWMAHAVQFPYEPGHVAVVMKSKQQGTGKGFLANTFGKLFGRHFKSVTNVKHIFGQFNSLLEDCVVLFADEAFWAGSHTQKSALKVLITEPRTVIERKGLDAEPRHNYVHLLMASNEKWVVPVEANDRRFFVLDVGEDRMQDTEYFARIADYMETRQGYEALLHFLLTMDLSDFDVRKFPDTEARREQRKHSIAGFDEWWFSKLTDGHLLEDGWPSDVWCIELHADYLRHARSWESKPEGGPTKLGVFMRMALGRSDYKKQAPAVEGGYVIPGDMGETHDLTRPYFYETMTLEKCRQVWEDLHGPMEWPTVETATPEDSKEEEPF